MPQRLFLLACAAATLAFAACLDALYEDLPPPAGFTGSWVICCLSGRINTCPCDAGEVCAPELRACATGSCAPSASGSCGGGGSDGGPVGDGGSTADAGPLATYTPCCTQGLLSTCACGPTGCDGGTFTPCYGGRCISDGGSCP